MKIILKYALLILTAFKADAQNTFEIFKGSLISDVVQSSNNDFYYCGWSYNSWNAYLLKTNNNGVQSWEKNIYGYPNSGVTWGDRFEKLLLSDNNLYMSGTFIDVLPDNTYNSDFLLFKTDLNGNTIFSKNFNSGGKSNDEGHFLTKTKDNKVILGGKGWDGSGTYGAFIRTDLAGTISNHNLGNPSPYIQGPINDIIETDDNHFITLSTQIVKTDSMYNKIWRIYIPSTEFYSITSYDNNTFYAVGAKFDDNSNQTDRILVKFNNLGDILFSKEYNDSECNISSNAKYEPEYFSSIDTTIDNNLILSGVVSTNCSSPTNYKHIGFIQKIDLSGNIIWTKWFNDINDRHSVIKTVKSTNDGGYISVGSLDDNLVGNGYDYSTTGYICKSDANGNGCSTTDDFVVINEIRDINKEIIVIENPIKNKEVYIDSETTLTNYEIISLNGELIFKSEIINNRFVLNQNIKGIVFIKLFDKNILVKTSKIIIE
jgi:hypothetical protein